MVEQGHQGAAKIPNRVGSETRRDKAPGAAQREFPKRSNTCLHTFHTFSLCQVEAARHFLMEMSKAGIQRSASIGDRSR